MPGDLCIACGSTRKKDPGASFHRFPVDERRRGVWLRVFQLQETQVKPHTRVCSRHFPGGDATKDPQVGLVIVNRALLSQVEFLQSENQRLKKELQKAIETLQHFRVEHIKHNDKLVCFYMGIAFFIVFSVFFHVSWPSI